MVPTALAHVIGISGAPVRAVAVTVISVTRQGNATGFWLDDAAARERAPL